MLTAPFPEFSSSFWSTIDPRVIASEDLVSKMHTIELLEQLSPFRGHTDPYFQRVWRALDDLQQFSDVRKEWLSAALVVFGNVIYFPQALLDDAWRSLYIDMIEQESAPGTHLDFQIFENDPSGMANTFCHLNKLEGRLDHERYPRVASADELADLLLDFLNPLKRDSAAATAGRLFRKDIWALLVDKTLSGHSLVSDVTRFLVTHKMLLNAGFCPPKIVILAQVMTADAERILRACIDEACERTGVNRHSAISYYRAIYLDKCHSITSSNSRLIRDRSLIPHIRDLSRWFADKFIAGNTDFDRMRERSGDDLRYGYRRCGLTIADYDNCPTDSLPLLWFLSEDLSCPYRAPFPRVHSRIGPQLTERSVDKWKAISESPQVGEGLARALTGSTT